MATIKSYTTIEQSRKLTKILPIESADMYYHYNTSVVKNYHEDIPNVIQLDNHFAFFNDDIPCWSLAALLGVLPKNLNIGRPSLESNYKGYYWIQYYDEFMKPNNYKTECFSNPVDACYEMIIKLHECKKL